MTRAEYVEKVTEALDSAEPAGMELGDIAEALSEILLDVETRYSMVSEACEQVGETRRHLRSVLLEDEGGS